MGQWQEALRLLDEMKKNNIAPDTITYSAAISACEKGGQSQEALRLLDEMKKNNIPPNTITYNAAISACEKGGQWQEALRLLDEMKKNNIAPNTITYNAAISACEKGEQWQEALRLLDEMESKKLLPREITVASIIDFHGFCLSICKIYLRKYVGLKIIRKIIVGKGKHSVDCPVLKQGLLDFLGKNYAGILKCEEDAKNSG